MGAQPPFLYDRPSKYSFTAPTDRAFNPRAASEAAWSPPKPRPARNGPLINSINRHPDSYFAFPYGNLNWKPMSPNTKAKVKYIRWVQLFFRVCALVGALGMLFCVICIRGTQGTDGWIIRVPPAVAIVHNIYGVYHLMRSSTGRTPASTASYMIFAAVLDAGIIPFFVLTAIMSRNEYSSPSRNWQTLFDTDGANYKIIFATFLVSVVNGSLHLISLFISLHLAVMFRQIAGLPPDMNPLEDHLTSRHKKNKSSLQTITTASSTNRNSKAEEALIAPPRTVPFLHTRAESLTNFANVLHPQSNTHNSRMDNPSTLYEEPRSKRSSRADNSIPIANRPNSSIYSEAYHADASRSQPTKQPRSESPPITSDNENWTSQPSPPPSPFEFKHLRNKPYQPLPQSLPFEVAEKDLMPNPLEMNPPTPPNNLPPRREGHGRDVRPLLPGTGNLLSLSPDVKIKRGGYRGLGNGKVRSAERVVSSGVEVRIEEVAGKGVRAREVSGKVAEEGRGDRMWRERSARKFRV